MARKFIYDGKELPDPDPGMKVDEVRQNFAEFFPELSNASRTEKKDGEDTVITFSKRVGTKGMEEKEKIETREVFASKENDNLHGFIEFSLRDNSSRADSALLRAAASWIDMNSDYTLLAVVMDHKYAESTFHTGLTLFVEG